jgi:hypothetical protein
MGNDGPLIVDARGGRVMVGYLRRGRQRTMPKAGEGGLTDEVERTRRGL